mmetsp:Transcript_102/g.207  ORF Transcript_102/g.207 Transcript_102/m.207 type:complete len:373 (+) Transcript_102:84-1202(+)
MAQISRKRTNGVKTDPLCLLTVFIGLPLCIMCVFLFSYTKESHVSMQSLKEFSSATSSSNVGNSLYMRATSTSMSLNEKTTAIDSNDPTRKERSFLEIGQKYGTDKVAGNFRLAECLKNSATCTRAGCKNERCRPWGHFYNTMYQQKFGSLFSTDQTPPFQFLEIGFYNGKGFESYMEFMPNAEAHSMEISCIEQGPREEGKWPWGNFAEKNHRYKEFLKNDRLHCGDANDIQWLHDTWTTKMNRTDAPPLKFVVDDGAHVDFQMVTTLLFWFPKIQPKGFLVVEDIQPIQEANKFRTQFLPQMMADLHYCGDPKLPDEPCFPTLQPLLQSIHCEMHICVFERNDHPAIEYDLELSKLPPNALDLKKCKSFQ